MRITAQERVLAYTYKWIAEGKVGEGLLRNGTSAEGGKEAAVGITAGDCVTSYCFLIGDVLG